MTATEPAPALPDQGEVDATIKLVTDHADRIFLWNYDREPRPARHALQQGHVVAVERVTDLDWVDRRRPRGARATRRSSAARRSSPRAAAERRRLAARDLGRARSSPQLGIEIVQGPAQPVHARRAGRDDDRGQDRRDGAVDRRQVLRRHADDGRGPPHRGVRQVPPHQARRGVPDEPVPRGADRPRCSRTAAGTSPTSACRSSSRAWRSPRSATCCARTEEPLLNKLLRYVMSDEARHVAFGVLSLAELYQGLTEAELKDRQEFLVENTLRSRARSTTPEIWERMGVDVDAVLPVHPRGGAQAARSTPFAGLPAAASSPSSCPTCASSVCSTPTTATCASAGARPACSSSSSPTTPAPTTRATTRWRRTAPRAAAVDERRRTGRSATLRGAPHRRRRRRRLADGRARLATAARSRRAMIHEALADAGLTLADVDGVVPRRQSSMALAEYLGIHPRYTDGTDDRRLELRGPRRARGRRHRRRAVRRRRRRVRRDAPAATASGAGAAAAVRGMPPGPNPMLEWEMPYGLRLPMGAYALAASRHMAEYGTTSEQLAQIAVEHPASGRRCNPRARYHDPITVDDVLASPMEASPLHQLDCCLVTDGAGAFVHDPRRAGPRPAPSRRSTCSAPATAHDHTMISQMPDLTDDRRARSSGADGVRDGRHQARRRRPADGLRQLHDHRAAAPRGPRASAPRARAAPSSRTASSGPGGSLPMNTNGGGLSLHPPRHVRHVPDRRGRPPAPRRGRRPPGRRRRDRRRPRLGRRAVDACRTVVLGTEATL